MAKPTKSKDSDSSVPEPNPAPAGRRAIHGDNDADYGDRVAQRAYELYLARGGEDGRDFEDWLTAERELTNGHDQQADYRK